MDVVSELRALDESIESMLEKRKSEHFDKVYDALNVIVDLETLTENDVGNLIETLEYHSISMPTGHGIAVTP